MHSVERREHWQEYEFPDVDHAYKLRREVKHTYNQCTWTSNKSIYCFEQIVMIMYMIYKLKTPT